MIKIRVAGKARLSSEATIAEHRGIGVIDFDPNWAVSSLTCHSMYVFL